MKREKHSFVSKVMLTQPKQHNKVHSVIAIPHLTSDLNDKANAPNLAADYVASYQQDYLVFGIGQPCNSYNNNTGPVTKAPNCIDTTTSIVLAPDGFQPPPGETPPPLETSKGRSHGKDSAMPLIFTGALLVCLLTEAFV